MEQSIETTAAITTTLTHPMGWWYFFGAWIAFVVCVLLVAWSLLDAYRRGELGSHSIVRYIWPIVGCIGCLLILPSLMEGSDALLQDYGSGLAYVGIIGTVVTGFAMIAFFSRPSSDGNTLFTLTKNAGTTATSTHDTTRRRRRAVSGAGVSAPLPKSTRKKEITPLSKSDESAEVSEGDQVTLERKRNVALVEDDIATEMSEKETILEDSDDDVTIVEDSDTIAETIVEDSRVDAETILEDSSDDATIVEEPDEITEPDNSETILWDPDDEAMPSASLQITGGKTSRIVFTPDRNSFIVGRNSTESNFAVSDSRVSKQHFCIEPTEDGYVILDLKSSNGTFVNGKRITSTATLHHDDVIEFGRIQARFVIDSEK